MKKWIGLAVLGIAIVAIAVSSYYFATSKERHLASDNADQSLSLATAPTSSSDGIPAVWASTASKVPELVAEADLVVRATVIIEPKTRPVSFTGPMWSEDGKAIMGQKTDVILFSDTQFEVVETYKGSPEPLITVMQTGGLIPSSDGKVQQTSLEGDPLFTQGSEYILFLVDISGDAIHAPDRKLYRTVNPAGRYEIRGQNVLNFSEFAQSTQLPKTVNDLLDQIRQATSTQNP